MELKIMNNEVNLILTKLKIVSEDKENGMYLCDKKHSKILLDYITNLQEENERLKEEKENLTHIVANKIIKDYDIDTPLKNQLIEERSKYISLSDVCHDYKSGCEKAIELIEKSRVKATPFFKQFDGDLIMPKREVDKLLNILNGD
jgi:hypothetical protein